MPGCDVLDPRHRHGRQRLAALLLALLAAPGASGAWSAGGGGQGAARAGALPPGPTPLAAGIVTTVSVSWAAVPAPAAGYVVQRYDGLTGAPSAIGGTCAGVVVGTNCTDASVPAGLWRYSVAAVRYGWSGSEGPLSLLVTVSL